MRFFSGNRNGGGSGDNKGPASLSFMQKLKGGGKKSDSEASFAAIKEKTEGQYNRMLADYDKSRTRTIGGRTVNEAKMSQTAKDTLQLLARRKAQKDAKKEAQEVLEREKQKKNKARQAQLLEAQAKSNQSQSRDIFGNSSSSSSDKEKSYFFGYTDDPIT